MKSIWLHSFLMKIICHDIHQKASYGDIPNEGFFAAMDLLVESVRRTNEWDTNFALKFMLYFAIL